MISVTTAVEGSSLLFQSREKKKKPKQKPLYSSSPDIFLSFICQRSRLYQWQEISLALGFDFKRNTLWDGDSNFFFFFLRKVQFVIGAGLQCPPLCGLMKERTLPGKTVVRFWSYTPRDKFGCYLCICMRAWVCMCVCAFQGSNFTNLLTSMQISHFSFIYEIVQIVLWFLIQNKISLKNTFFCMRSHLRRGTLLLQRLTVSLLFSIVALIYGCTFLSLSLDI